MIREIKETLKLGAPIAIGNLSHILMALTDSIMVGGLGTAALAAVSFSGAVLGFVIIVCLGMTSAMSSLVARQKGGGNNLDCGQILWHGLVLNTIFGLLCALFLLFLSWNLHWFGQPEEILPQAKGFLLIVGMSIPFVVVFNTYRTYSEGLSRAKPILIFLFSSLLLNAFLNWLWIYGHWGFPAMGVNGSAWATLLSQ